MLNSRLVLILQSLKHVYHLHFCHACLNLLMDELAVAQCSSFVKHHEWLPAMYFVSMFECCSIFILMHLVGHLLLIADRCHICFACHFLTMHPIPVIFISISTEITSPFQWHSWFPSWGQVQSFLCKSCICITYRIPHIIPCLHHVVWALHVVDCVPLSCCSCLGRAGRRVCEREARWVRLRRSSQLWQLCRQDDHTLEITYIFAC